MFPRFQVVALIGLVFSGGVLYGASTGASPSEQTVALEKAVISGDSKACAKLLGEGVRGTSRMVESAVSAHKFSTALVFRHFGYDWGEALYHSAARGDHVAVRFLLQYGASPDPFRGVSLDTPLCAAVRAKSALTTMELLQAGVPVDQLGGEGQAPLLVALTTNRPDLVRLLLERGANPNQPVRRPVSREFIALVPGKTLRWVLKNDTGATPVMFAADSGMPEITALMMKHGARLQVHTRKANLWPINFPARKGDVHMVRLMLGKDPLLEERRIVVNLRTQRAVVLNSSGEVLFETKISTGRKNFPTPTGVFVITNKHRTWKSNLYEASMPYFQRLSCGDFGFHEGVVPDHPASHGCIRVPSGKAQRMYALTQVGDRVEILE